MAIAIRELELSKVTEGGLLVARVLRTIRKERGWTQRQVAERWNLTVDGYRPYEQGRRQLRVTQIPSLAKALGIDQDELARQLGIDMKNEAVPEQASAARELAALVASDLAELLLELRDVPPDGWHETIETWRMQAATRRDSPSEN